MSDNVPPIANVSSKNFHTRLFENILALDEFLDAVLSAENQRIQVHRFVLAAGSKYFHKLLRCNANSNNFPIFVFTDIRFEHMKRIVQYLYTGKTQVRADELEEFFRVAKQLEILGLYNEVVPEDLPGMTARSNPRNSRETSNNTTSSESVSIIFEQQDKRHMNSNGLNNGSKSNNRKRVRVETDFDSAKGSTAYSSKPSKSKVPPGQRNGIPSNRKEKMGSQTDARNKKVAGNNGDEQEANGNQRQSDDSNGNGQIRCNVTGCGMSFQTAQELRRHKKHKCGKTKEFQCQTCQKSFYLRIGLQNHYKTSTCEQLDDESI